MLHGIKCTLKLISAEIIIEYKQKREQGRSTEQPSPPPLRYYIIIHTL